MVRCPSLTDVVPWLCECHCRLSQCECLDGFFEPDALLRAVVAEPGGVGCVACPEMQLKARSLVNGQSSMCTRMEPCTSLEQGENLTFSVFVRLPNRPPE